MTFLEKLMYKHGLYDGLKLIIEKMKKIDKLIIFILLKICSILTNYSDKISSTDIFTVNQKIEEIEE